MCQRNGSYGYVTRQVLAFLRAHPGVWLTAGELAQQLRCPLAQVRMALDSLADHGVIDKEPTARRGDRYLYHPC